MKAIKNNKYILPILFLGFGLSIGFFVSIFFFDYQTADSSIQNISDAPFIIEKSGNYVLTNNLSCTDDSAQACIQIDADNVILDLNGFKISCTTESLDRKMYGIWAENQHHITIKNGEVEGFFYGIYFQDISRDGKYQPEYGSNTVIKMTLSKNTFRGIRVEGLSNTVVDNIVADTHGTTVFEDAFAIGIESIGDNCLIENNRVFETYATDNGESVGISLSALGTSQINNNFIFNRNPPVYDSWGIWASGVTGPYIYNNKIVGYKHGIGLYTDAHGIFDNNLIYGADVPVDLSTTTMIDGGNNHAISEYGDEFSYIYVNSNEE